MTDDEFIAACSLAKSVAEVIKKQGQKPSGGNYKSFYLRVDRLKVDTSHFLGQSHGTTGAIIKQPLEEILVKNSTYSNNSKLRKRLVREGLKEDQCEQCALVEWLGEPLSLDLHHKNGDHFDNRLENLQILCPNCHDIFDKHS